MLRTTNENLTSFKQDIPWTQLSRTFQEAISFARHLGLNYIWIDSLCIIQDVRRDWQEQSALMATIYSNAYLTMAAGLSASTRSWSPNADTKPSLARLRRTDGSSTPIYGRKGFKHSVGDLPLLRRGWVYQERLLSPRIIYFGSAEVVWECREVRECQCGLAAREWPARPRVPVNLRFDPPYYFGGPDTPHERWRGIIKDYSQLELTYPNDIFPALSGLAQAFQELMNDKYAAGFWVKRMAFDLLWYRKGCSNPFVRSSVHTNSIFPRWRAPSWSWASTHSVTVPIEFLSCTKPLVEAIEVEAEASGIDPYGELRKANLRLKARSISASIKHGMFTFAGMLFSKETYRDEGAIDPYAATIRLVGMECLNTGRYRDFRVLQFGSHVEDLPFGRSTDAWLHACFRREARSYMIIAEDTMDLAHWKRVGLMVVVANVSDPSYNRPLERAHYANRVVFQTFDKAPLQEYTIW
ncbi:heterokaryon incompatibility protein-domain-containing protein [Paraphoma chrysanthemicola]|uniref:Heterokaryon incompatibility protein-domain-containing protein n=1 Tax=Paraphoma chrysanthemicola TaxID=798071 RepID=A0A8K0QVV0_9PLEO|nr:heterokaryon incompatibility protein-domain-containing protein [Paraphoma chrysanthemicola]